MKRATKKRSPDSTPALRGQPLGPALQRYFCQYLMNQRQLSPRTIAAYRDTFKLLLEFIDRTHGPKPEDLTVGDLDAARVLAFLTDLERSRRNSPRSRNARLAAIRSFLRHALTCDPLLLPVAQQVLAIPGKRFERTIVGHVTRQQMRALLDAPDGSTKAGLRDGVLLAVMYNTGARVSEIAGLKVGDLRLDTGASIHIRGKGRKQRTVPLWRETVRLLRRWLDQIDSEPQKPLLPNARGEHMTRSGIEHRLGFTIQRAAAKDPSLLRLRISPHTIRHTTAMHLLQSGVDLSMIAMWLGHENIQTTHQYLNADLASKKQALAHLQSPGVRPIRAKATRPLMQFLEGL